MGSASPTSPTPEVIEPEAQIAAFLSKYGPETAADLRAARSRLRRLFPRGFELVYDNYNALAMGFAPTERAATAIVSVAAYPNWVTLFFLHGKDLEDAQGLLQGSGARVRSIRLKPLTLLDSRPVRALIAQAIRPHRQALKVAPPLTTVVKSVSVKQRPRRPRVSTRPKT
jgi:hypothetical protein